MHLRICLVGVALSAVCAVTGSASAQSVSAAPISSTLNLTAGFTPDPRTVSVVAGGERSASELGPNCKGYISNSPDVRLNYTAGSVALTIKTESSTDSALVINLPDGSWVCDDDSNGNLDAKLRFPKPRSGQYDIWIASLTKGELSSGARLIITELD
jgi:hypothetical protein